MAEHEIDNEYLTEFLSDFINHFQITHFFLKPVPMDDFPIVEEEILVNDLPTTYIEKQQETTLGSEHYNLIWLISELCKSSPHKLTKNKVQVVKKTDLLKVFLWYTEPTMRYVNNLDYLLKKIINTGHLEVTQIKRTFYYCLSREGIELLEDLRTERKKYISKFFKVGKKSKKIKEKNYPEIIKFCEEITPKLWETIIKEAKKIPKPKKKPATKS